MTSPAYIVTRPYAESGIGSNLASLAGAVHVAKHSGRSLIVDWRGLDVLVDKSVNYFSELFAPIDEIHGVPVLVAGDPGTPEHRNAAPEECKWIGAAQALANGTLQDPRFLVLQPYHGLDRIAASGDFLSQHRFVKSVYDAVTPRPDLAAKIEQWHAEHLLGHIVVAVNIRTGNRHAYWKDRRNYGRMDPSIVARANGFLRRLKLACDARARGLPRPLRSRYKIFIATDAAESRELLLRLPNSVARREVFLPPGSLGGVSDFGVPGYTDRDAAADTVADMFLLARGHALVFNFSMFNQYARVVTDYFGGNQFNIERLYARTWVRKGASELRRRLGVK